jgi:hypothetical protein
MLMPKRVMSRHGQLFIFLGAQPDGFAPRGQCDCRSSEGKSQEKVPDYGGVLASPVSLCDFLATSKECVDRQNKAEPSDWANLGRNSPTAAKLKDHAQDMAVASRFV